MLFVALAAQSGLSGTYKGSTSIVGAEVDASITIDSSTTLDFDVSGNVPQPISCKAEALTYDGDSTITLPNSGKTGDCVHDALGSATISAIAYDGDADTITVTMDGQGLDVKMTLSKATTLVEMPAKAVRLSELEA